MLLSKEEYGQERENVLSHFHEIDDIEDPAEKNNSCVE
jgi:hypothetical protein